MRVIKGYCSKCVSASNSEISLNLDLRFGFIANNEKEVSELHATVHICELFFLFDLYLLVFRDGWLF